MKAPGQSRLECFYVGTTNEGKADSFPEVAFTIYPSSSQLQEILVGILPSTWLYNELKPAWIHNGKPHCVRSFIEMWMVRMKSMF